VRSKGIAIFKTALGWAGVTATERGISKVVLPKKDKNAVERELRSSECGIRSAEQIGMAVPSVLGKAVRLLKKYFSSGHILCDLPLDIHYYTTFQQAVWRAALMIPSGETRSYAWIAKRIKRPLAARAVGQALGANPIPVIIPCHRVISSAGTLGGFSGGLGMKKKLLDLEANAHVHH
jgi:methylated-DNA-[protein]-cysteine S-methyltransferase